MKPKRLFAVMQEMECLAGDTLEAFTVKVEDDGEAVDISGCTMHLIAAKYEKPAETILEKECSLTEDGFTVALTSEDTAGWMGDYGLHFVLYDGAGLAYRKLAGILHVYPVPKGGTI